MDTSSQQLFIVIWSCVSQETGVCFLFIQVLVAVAALSGQVSTGDTPSSKASSSDLNKWFFDFMIFIQLQSKKKRSMPH